MRGMLRSLFIAPFIATTAAAATPSDYSAARERAVAISNALLRGDARAFRLATTAELDDLDRASDEALAERLEALVDVAAERGAQGLEGAIASTAAALGSRGFEGWVRADLTMTRLAEDFWIDSGVRRPNAAVPVARPGSPTVQYLPIGVGRALLVGQLETGLLDLESTFGAALCSDEWRAQLGQRYGARMADLLAALCSEGGIGGHADLSPGLSLGFGSEVSLVDCLRSHSQTRAERIDAMMRACSESLLALGEGDPIAEGRPLPKSRDDHGNLSPLPDDPEPSNETWEEKQRKAGEMAWDVIKKIQDDRIESEIDREPAKNGDTTKDYLDKDLKLVRSETRDANGNLKKSIEVFPDGFKVVREFNKDGTIKSERRYDKDGKEITPKPAKETEGGELSDFGETPECRELTVALIEERAASLLIAGGLVDPRAAHPTPDAGPGEDPADLACLGLAGGPTLDAGFMCNAEVALCPAGEAPDAVCACRKIPTMTPSEQCGRFVVCADGMPPQATDGECRCRDYDEVFHVDNGAGPRPRPTPNDNTESIEIQRDF